MDNQPHCPETSKAIRLVNFLLGLEQIVRTTTLIRDIADYKEVLWLSSIPDKEGCFTQAWRYWENHVDKTEGAFTLQLSALKSLRDALKSALSLEGHISNCQDAINDCQGIDTPVWTDETHIEKIISSCRLALARIRKQCAIEDIQNAAAPISHTAARDNAHPVTNNLLEAIHNRDSDAFSQCINTIFTLRTQHDDLQKVNHKLSILSHSLPQFARSLEQTCNETHWEERIQHINEAWCWAQARDWIEEYVIREDASALEQHIKHIDDEINNVIEELASLNAWSACFSHFNENHRRHMEAWQQSMHQLGLGQGRYAQYHRENAQKHLDQCRKAIPAWVMPLDRIWDTINPAPEMFDVIIVDEASQCGLEALSLFYLAKKIVIIGDDKQIGPETVGKKHAPVHCLMKQYLHDFDFRSMFDLERSLFDHGKILCGKGQITLREHFRCMPEIIRFSNELCYSDTPLIPLRNYRPDRLPPLKNHYVKSGYREGSRNHIINRPEADAIVDEVVRMCGDSQYDGKTMGIVVLQGDAQVKLIEDQLRNKLSTQEIKHRKLVCGTSKHIQGDERDIIFLSLVAAGDKIRSITTKKDERRFNVAASRAKDMMILFHSVQSKDLGQFCLRRKLLEFFENPIPQQIHGTGINRDELERRAAQDSRSIIKPPKPFDSWFEVDVALQLLRRQFNVIPQYPCAGRRIDLVVDGGGARLAIECDGDYWHGEDQFNSDMQRQRQLERCGWEFFRVRESVFYADKESALASLWQKLEERRIFPSPQCEITLLEENVNAPASPP